MNKKRIMSAIACGCLAVMMTACGGSDKYADSPYVGSWEGTTAEYAGIELDVSSMMGGFSLDFEADGSVSATIGDEVSKGEWSETETGIMMTDDSKQEMEFTADGDNGLIVEQDGVTIHFEKK